MNYKKKTKIILLDFNTKDNYSTLLKSKYLRDDKSAIDLKKENFRLNYHNENNVLKDNSSNKKENEKSYNLLKEFKNNNKNCQKENVECLYNNYFNRKNRSFSAEEVENPLDKLKNKKELRKSLIKLNNMDNSFNSCSKKLNKSTCESNINFYNKKMNYFITQDEVKPNFKKKENVEELFENVKNFINFSRGETLQKDIKFANFKKIIKHTRNFSHYETSQSFNRPKIH